MGIKTSSVAPAARLGVALTLGTVDPSTFDVKCPASETFWKVLEAHDIRFTEVHNPTSCPIHDTGPGNELALAKVNAELEALGNLEQTKAVARQRRDLLARVASSPKKLNGIICTFGNMRSKGHTSRIWKSTSNPANAFYIGIT